MIRFIVFLTFIPGTLFAQEQNGLKYGGIKTPGRVPQLFAPGLVTQDGQHEFGSVFSSDGTEFFYAVDLGGRAEIRSIKLKNNYWTKPATVISHEIFSYNDPMLSPDGSRLYFISDRAANNSGQKKDYDIWFIVKTKSGWSAPVNAGSEINSPGHEYYISFSQNGTMYFSSNRKNGSDDFNIYSSKVLSGKFQKPEMVSDSINTQHYEADVFVAPDESYLIFCAVTPDGYGAGDLYISFRNDDGSWTKAKNMGDAINTPGHELCPFVTPDGKYFLFTSRQDLYWVDATIIADMKTSR